MEQSAFPISQNMSLERLVSDALGEIERLGYSRRSENRYRTTWEHLIEFSCRKGRGDQFFGRIFPSCSSDNLSPSAGLVWV